MNDSRRLAVLKAGIVPTDMVTELARWGNYEVPQVSVEPDPRVALAGIREAVESHDTVALRLTDLDALKYYDQNQQKGRLYYSLRGGPATLRNTTFIEVIYAKTPEGNYIIPWTDEDIFDLMLDDGTYLKPAGEARVHFANIDELYYGEKKAFMVCTPAIPEPQ
jgi:hypothetical protein